MEIQVADRLMNNGKVGYCHQETGYDGIDE